LLLRSLLFSALVFLLPAVLVAQRTNASISGTITDPSGAYVSGTVINAVETKTGVKTEVTSQSDGSYLLANLTPGIYQLSAEKPGFELYVQKGIVLTVDQSAAVNIQLRVGSPNTSVTVTGQAPQVDVRSQQIQTVITPEMAQELPLNGRNVLQLMSLAPDVSPSVPIGYYSYYAQAAVRPESTTTFVSASGGRGNSSAFYLDGGINEDPYTQVANVFPNPDAIQEFSFVTNSYDAKFGGHGGGVVNAITRGGTNEFHGALFEFLRNGDLNARNFFASTNDGLKRNQYGAGAGGPIRKNRTFFFGSWQGTTLRSAPSENVAITPTEAQRAGDFSGTTAQLSDPRTGAAFPGNRVPTSLFDPISVKILALTPVGAPDTGLAYYSSVMEQNDNQVVARVDNNFGDKLRIYGRYLYDNLEQPSRSISTNILTAVPSKSWTSQNFALNAAYIFTPNLVATATATYNRVLNIQIGPPDFPSLTSLGANIPNLTKGSKNGVDISISGYFSTFWDGLYRVPRDEYDINSNWSWIAGKHTIEFGGEITRQANTLDQDFLSDGYFTFGSQLSGNNLVDFLLGAPDSFSQAPPIYSSLRRTLPALFVNDTWKVSRRLTLSLGVRWSPWVPWNDIIAHQVAVFNQGAYDAGTHSTRYPNLPPGMFVGGDPGVPEAGMGSFYHIFDPRIGLAYDPFGDGKTSIRAGFGIYHDEPTAVGLNNMADQPPFNQAASIPFPASFSDPYLGKVNPFPSPSPPPPSSTYATPFFVTAFDPAMTYPVIQQWNLTVERQLASNILVRAAYEGMESYHLPGGIEANPAIYIPGQSTFQNVQARRPLGADFTNVVFITSGGTTSFNGLTLTVEKRLSHGVSLIGGYRWAKVLDQISQTDTSHADYTNPYDLGFDRALADYDVRHELTASFVWQMPGYQSLGPILHHVLGNWSLNGILTLRSGFPYTIYSGIPYSMTGGEASWLERGDLIGNPSLSGDRSRGAQLTEWFNTSAFTYNTVGTYGNSPRNFLIGPGSVNFDFSAVKSFPLRRESQRIDFRAEFFNLFNRPNFSNPDTYVLDSTFGQILTAGSPRILQFGLKFTF
jgi:hypothetical protein